MFCRSLAVVHHVVRIFVDGNAFVGRCVVLCCCWRRRCALCVVVLVVGALDGRIFVVVAEDFMMVMEDATG